MTKLDRPPVLAKRLPASGNSALAASALIQAALGLEFTLSGLNKLADPPLLRQLQRLRPIDPRGDARDSVATLNRLAPGG